MTAPIELTREKLRHVDSLKWTTFSPDVLPLWVADMDFAIAPSILSALHERLARPLGYHHMSADPTLVKLLRAKVERSGMVGLPETGWVNFLAGVVQGLYGGVLGLTAPGDEVLTFTPIYPPFLSAITDHGRIARHVKLLDTDAGWQIDFDALESAISPSTKLLMLCHPHNPTGRVWTPAELTKIARLAEARGLYVLSDELHADLTLDGGYVPFVNVVSDAMKLRTLTLIGPCKTYNLAGVGIGAMISHSAPLLTTIRKAMAGGGHCQALSVAMWRAALEDDGDWLTKVLSNLRENRDFVMRFVGERLPGVRVFPPQATYLAWLDYRSHIKAAGIQKYLLSEAKVGLNAGADFGPGFDGYVRLNFATSREILHEALERLARVHSPG